MGTAATASGTPLGTATEALRTLGYEPRIENDEVVANCPFHALAMTHTQIVCGMNLGLLDGLCERIGGLAGALQPEEGRCCVVLAPTGCTGPD